MRYLPLIRTIKYSRTLHIHSNKLPLNLSGCNTFNEVKSILPAVPHSIWELVRSTYLKSSISKEQKLEIIKFVNNTEKLLPAQRHFIFKYLVQINEDKLIIEMGNRHLITSNGDLLTEISISEMKTYINALIRLGKVDTAVKLVNQFTNQFGLNRKIKTIRLINFTFYSLYTNVDPVKSLLMWISMIKVFHGHCELTNYHEFKYVLKALYFFFQKHPKTSDYLVHTLEQSLDNFGSLTTSEFTSTLIGFFSYTRRFMESEIIWDFKVKNNLHIVPIDLTSIMKTYCHFSRWNMISNIYERYPSAHDEYAQFDYILIAYSKLQQWEDLKNQFNALFGIGELPSIKHYGIVMYAISNLGEVSLIERLYNQLLRRGMQPDYSVLQSLLNVNYKVGNFHGALREFELFQKYNVKPTSSTYLLLLKIYGHLNNIDACLKILKKMSTEAIDISELHFAYIINLCARFTNYAIAEELFQIMQSHYYLEPTEISIHALMNVYLKSSMPKEALSLFKKFEESSFNNSRMIYSKAIEAYMELDDIEKCEELFQKILKNNQEPDSKFYLVLIKFLAVKKKDYISAEDMLNQLINHPTLKVSSDHFEILLGEYDRVSYLDGMAKLFRKMTDIRVALGSKALYYLVKSTFEIEFKKRNGFINGIKWLESIMQRAASNELNLVTNKLHPSIVAYPVKMIARYDDPIKAIDLLSMYHELFCKGDPLWNNKLVLMRSLMIIFAEIGKWGEFETMFTKFMERLDEMQNAPSAIVKNKNLASALVGIFTYKVEQLVILNQIEKLPELLNKLETKGYVLDNDTWNKVILALVNNKETLDYGLELVNNIFIHGYNLVHKIRFLDKKVKNYPEGGIPWLIERKQQCKNSFHPTKYLSSKTYIKVSNAVDNHLSLSSDVSSEVKRLITKYKHFMKSYLLKPRKKVHGWDIIESKHASYLRNLRYLKRVVPENEF